MYSRVSYASAADGTYTNASPMPVRIWTVSSVSDALPKTYHHPIGPAAARGIGCVSIGRRLERTASRVSNQFPMAGSQRFIVVPPGADLGPPFDDRQRHALPVQRILQRRVVGCLD